MNKLNIKIIIASVREGRFGDKPTKWIADIAKDIDDFSVELLDLKDYPLPIFSEAVSPADVQGAYANPLVNPWAEKIASADGFVIVTPEYNHGYPSSLKNNMDYLYKEWNKKPIAFVGYGTTGGAFSVGQIRQVAIELQMAPVRTAVHIASPWSLIEKDGALKSGAFDKYANNARKMLEQLEWWAKALKDARGHEGE
ncbi:MAG: NAD(P)H-dependent oxidoreductase [Patescibacteria group bacterium]